MESDDKILTAIFEQSEKKNSEDSYHKEKKDDFEDEDFSNEKRLLSAENDAEEEVNEGGSFQISALNGEEENDENYDSFDEINEEINYSFAKPKIYSKKGTNEISCGFVLKEGVYTELPIEPEDFFDLVNKKGEKEEASEWLLFLHDSNDEVLCVLDYYKAIAALKNLAVYGEKYLTHKTKDFVITLPLSKDELFELRGEALRLEKEDAQKIDTGWSPDPTKAEGRMMYWAESYHYFIMLWLLVLSIHCPAMYDFGGFASVLKSAALSAAFLAVSFLCGIVCLYLVKPVLKMFDIEIFRFCIYFAHFVMVAFVIGFLADLIFLQSPLGFLGQDLAAISSVPLGLLLASIAVFKKEYNKLQRR